MAIEYESGIVFQTIVYLMPNVSVNFFDATQIIRRLCWRPPTGGHSLVYSFPAFAFIRRPGVKFVAINKSPFWNWKSEDKFIHKHEAVIINQCDRFWTDSVYNIIANNLSFVFLSLLICHRQLFLHYFSDNHCRWNWPTIRLLSFVSNIILFTVPHTHTSSSGRNSSDSKQCFWSFGGVAHRSLATPITSRMR